jgi:hypothetical protein
MIDSPLIQYDKNKVAEYLYNISKEQIKNLSTLELKKLIVHLLSKNKSCRFALQELVKRIKNK